MRLKEETQGVNEATRRIVDSGSTNANNEKGNRTECVDRGIADGGSTNE